MDKFTMGILKWEAKGHNFMEFMSGNPSLLEMSELFECVYDRKPENLAELMAFKTKIITEWINASQKAMDYLSDEERAILEVIGGAEAGDVNEEAKPTKVEDLLTNQT